MKLGAKYYIALTILSLSAFSFAEKFRIELAPAEELARLYVPTLAEAKKRGKEMEKGFYESRKKKAD